MSKLTQVFLIGGLVRFLLPLLVPSIVPVLGSIVEITTPITSFKALQEAFFFLNSSIDLYDGGVNHHPPLLVTVLSLVDAFPISNVWFHIIYSLTDLSIAWQLVQINKWYQLYTSKRTGKKITGFNDDLIASFYLFNPLILLLNLSHSTIVFTWLFVVSTIYQITVKKQPARAMILLAIASYLSLNSFYLLPAVLGLIHVTSRTQHTLGQIYVFNIGIYICTIALLILISFASTASWQFIDNCYLSVILFKKITPNVGLWWYLFTEMFEFFTPFYIGMFNIYSFVFVVPLALRLFEYAKTPKLGDSFAVVVLTLLWISFTKSYPTIGELGFALSFATILRGSIIPHCKMIYITGMTLVVSLILSPIFYYCWIVLGNGNSNFFYSINLIWGGVHIMSIMDLLWAQLIGDYFVENNVSDDEKAKLQLAQL